MAKNAKEICFETTFSRYVAERILGEGGAGRVYLVRDESGAPFALKLLLGQGVTTDKRRRFKNEIGFLQSTRHDNLVRVTDHGVQVDGAVSTPFYVMEMYDESLRGLMQRGIAHADVLRLFSQVLDGVEAAHLKGVVHRDLKPENILYCYETNRLAVADFGVARFNAEELVTSIETKPGTRLANFQYAAPEQRVRDRQVGVAADIYALGLLLNELFTGQVPHGTGYRKIADAAPDCAWLDGIVDSMLRQDPAARPVSIDALKREIQFQRENVVSLQKISRIDETVVRVSDIDDPIIANGIRIVGCTWDNGMLRFELSEPVNPKWIQALRNMGSYSSVMNKGPERFGFTGKAASIDAQEHEIEAIVQHFKNWLPTATRVYEDMLKRDAEAQAAAERAELLRRRKAEENNLRIQSTLNRLFTAS
ncbi:serine/threonine protein kinase [Paraburkholderia sp. GV068]|uniref:serine/threonine protein kinase n=1 Tax=unclassified Paraburkholderia TaxID=2615204 RepID=UPI000D496FD6|nr:MULTISPECIES: serine/threonine-protein kinase [unclassified Paraburkholderia]PTR04315.1 serine/threonine protein kinase [Paraburkholderia sp. GV072]PUB09272.1 serine/threonine protein kinase [Paraburkholderia sp. GV068]